MGWDPFFLVARGTAWSFRERNLSSWDVGGSTGLFLRRRVCGEVDIVSSTSKETEDHEVSEDPIVVISI
jgi:hypothetical protein